MGLDDITKSVNGYNRILYKNGILGDFIAFSPFTGEELPGGFWWTLQDKISDKFFGKDDDAALKDMMKNKGLYNESFDFKYTPQNMRMLIQDRRWYQKHNERQRKQHKDGMFCCGLTMLIDTAYYTNRDMYICDVPIQYCPFCGVKLPPEFDQENWWEKEFKTFKWYKDHKMYEWADDYVDEDDWTAEDYLRAYERIDAEREKMLESDKK